MLRYRGFRWGAALSRIVFCGQIILEYPSFIYFFQGAGPAHVPIRSVWRNLSGSGVFCEFSESEYFVQRAPPGTKRTRVYRFYLSPSCLLQKDGQEVQFSLSSFFTFAVSSTKHNGSSVAILCIPSCEYPLSICPHPSLSYSLS